MNQPQLPLTCDPSCGFAETAAPAVSIVIPHLNQPEHLARCLAALAAQREAPDLEVIVVDNGSRVLPQGLCDAYGATLLLEPQPGPGPARNRGAAASSGSLLAFIDADCIAAPDWLSAIVRRFDDPAVEIIGGDVRIWREQPSLPTALECYESVYAYQMRDYIRHKGFTGTGNLAVRREVLNRVGPFGDLHIAEDKDWGQRATRMGLRITYAPDVVAFHPARRSSEELFVKWDRQTAHLHAEARVKRAGRLRWLVYTAALAVSPAVEVLRIARSDRVRGLRERWLAFRVMALVRAHRVRVMLRLAAGGSAEALSGSWNRQ
ncbi:MAG: glycosyltransferase [Gammaproteobacteria bacterium]|nr:glycosyltransferase [Gammaproteobacteria bacterium]